jgi:O-antigen/teichoic acid export membrane protein
LAFLSIIANVINKGLAMLVMVFAVSLTLPYLGVERFGVWMTIASFVGMLSFLDLGVGNALSNRVTWAAAQKDSRVLAQVISGGLGFLLMISGIICIILFFANSLIPWERLIKISDVTTKAELRSAINVLIVLFSLSITSNGIRRVFAGLQRAFVSHIFGIIGSCFSIITLWFAASKKATISYLLLSTFGIETLACACLLLVLLKRDLFSFSTSISHSQIEARNLAHIGGLFLILQLGTMIGWGADSLIIASTLGAAQVAVFNVVQKLFQFVSAPIGIMNAPLWSAYADAHSRNDTTFIRNTFKKSISLTTIAAIFGVIVVTDFNQIILEKWTNGIINPPFIFIISFAIWTVCDSMGTSLAMFLNGCSLVKEQVLVILFLSIIALPIKFIFINLYGFTGMIAAYTIVYCAVTYWGYGYFFKKNIMKNLGIR